MKGLLYFVVIMAIIAGIGSGFWWLADGSTPQEQLEYLKVTFHESMEDSAAANTAETASKLGNVLKNNFDEAQEVYEHGAEAKYK